MTSFSILPILYLIQIVTLYRVTKRTHRMGKINLCQSKQVNLTLVVLTLWGGFSTYLGVSGYYQSHGFLSSLPGLWITQVPVLIVMLPWMLIKTLRQGIDEIIDQTPLHLIMCFEGLRTLAIGGIIKGYIGEFSLFYAKFVGVPDFLYGVTTLVAAVLIYKGVWKEKAAIIINLVGFIIIVPFGMVLINVGLPGTMFVVEESPGLNTIFEFPMSLAPTLVVPIFVIVNILVALRLLMRFHINRERVSNDSMSPSVPH